MKVIADTDKHNLSKEVKQKPTEQLRKPPKVKKRASKTTLSRKLATRVLREIK